MKYMKYICIYICKLNKNLIYVAKRTITTFLSRKLMITRLSIAFEDFPGSSIASQVMPPCLDESNYSKISERKWMKVIILKFQRERG